MEMPFNASFTVFAIAVFLGLILFVILTWINDNQKHSSRVLGLYMLLLAFFAFHDFMLYTGNMVNTPYLFRMPRPTIYLTGVFVYLYIRSMLYGELKFKKSDYLHLLPFLFFFVDLIPFYFVDRTQKLLQVRTFLENVLITHIPAEGWLPAQVNFVIIPVVTLGYVIASGTLIYQTMRGNNAPFIRQNVIVMNWLKLFWVIFTVFFVIWYLVFLCRNNIPGMGTLLIQAMISAVMTMFTGVCLLLFPSILYGFQGRMPLAEQDGIPGASATEAIPENAGEQSIVLSEERRQAFHQVLERLMEHDHPYLKPGYSMAELAATTGIPYYYLSVVINQHYGWNFNEYINWYRINYVKHLMEQPDAAQYTLEGLAQMAGFRSRITFARAFQKFVNCTPTEYLRRNKVAE